MQHASSNSAGGTTVSLKEAGRLLNITARKIYRGLVRGTFPLVHICTEWRILFYLADVENLRHSAGVQEKGLADRPTVRIERNRVELLKSISARLEAMGSPPNWTTSSGSRRRKTFANLCQQIHDQCVSLEQRGVDFRAGFEIKEAEIATHSARLAVKWIEADCYLPASDLPWCERRPGRGNWNPRRWFKKVLLKRHRQTSDYFFKLLRETGKFGTPVVCDAVLRSKQRQNKCAERFAREHELITEIEDVTCRVPFADAASTTKKRAAKLYVRALGLEQYCTKISLKGFFVTLTLPGVFHPNPSTGKFSWCGATPEEGHDELHRKWRLVQREVNRKFGKMMGIRVEEPHEDGCPHWHLLVYVKHADEFQLRKIIGHYFGSATAAKVEAIDQSKGRGSSYIMKYIMPVMSAGVDSMAARYQAHRTTWGKRAIQIFDLPGSSTLWDELRRIKAGTTQYKALSGYAKELRAAACDTDYCQFLCLLSKNRSTKRIKSAADRHQVVHEQISGRRVSILYSEREVFACSVSDDLRTTTVKRLQGIEDHGNPINTHLHTWKIERKPGASTLPHVRKDDYVVDQASATVQVIATVMHSYPRDAGQHQRCSGLGSEPPKSKKGFEDWHAGSSESVTVRGGIQSSQAKVSAPSRRLRLPGRGGRSDERGSTTAGSLVGPAEIADG